MRLKLSFKHDSFNPQESSNNSHKDLSLEFIDFLLGIHQDFEVSFNIINQTINVLFYDQEDFDLFFELLYDVFGTWFGSRIDLQERLEGI